MGGHRAVVRCRQLCQCDGGPCCNLRQDLRLACNCKELRAACCANGLTCQPVLPLPQGNLPIVITSTLCADSKGPLSTIRPADGSCDNVGVWWAVLGMACGQFTMWSFAWPMLQRVVDPTLTRRFFL